MPPHGILIKKNSKIKRNEFFYFLCNCEKPKIIQKRCEFCGAEYFQKKNNENNKNKDNCEKKRDEPLFKQSNNKNYTIDGGLSEVYNEILELDLEDY